MPGSASPTGTVNRSRVIRLPPTGSSLAAQRDGHGHPQVSHRRAVEFVVAPQPAGDRGHEGVVQRGVPGGAGPLELVEVHLDHVEVATEPTTGHDRRQRLGHRHDEPPQRGWPWPARRASSAPDGGPPCRPPAPPGRRRRGPSTPVGARDRATASRASSGPLGSGSGRGGGTGADRTRVGRRLEQQHAQLDRPHPVGQRVVELQHQCRPVALQALDEGGGPQRTGRLELGHGLRPGEVEDRGGRVGVGGVHPPEVEREVEVAVDPPRGGEQAGRADRALAEPGDHPRDAGRAGRPARRSRDGRPARSPRRSSSGAPGRAPCSRPAHRCCA